MVRSLKPLASLLTWRPKETHAEKAYGAIVAQARLPVFYQRFGVPDTLEGRFVVLSLHLFVVLHRLTVAGAGAQPLAQGLADRFATDMETVLREIGVGDLAIPKKVRGLAASGGTLLQDYDRALTRGEEALAGTIASALPLERRRAQAASERLTPYVLRTVRHLEEQPLRDLCAGTLTFPKP